MTAAFVDAAELMARALGHPGYAFAVIEHPVSSADAAGHRARAEAVADHLASLTADAPGDRGHPAL